MSGPPHAATNHYLKAKDSHLKAQIRYKDTQIHSTTVRQKDRYTDAEIQRNKKMQMHQRCNAIESNGQGSMEGRTRNSVLIYEI